VATRERIERREVRAASQRALCVRMSEGPSELVVTAALCRMLLESLERLDEEIASEAFVAELRDFCERAHGELERRAQSA
jgi:hypothetical protein